MGVVVARCLEGYAPRQNVRFFERAAIRQIHMALAWSPAKVPVQHISSTTEIKGSEDLETWKGERGLLNPKSQILST